MYTQLNGLTDSYKIPVILQYIKNTTNRICRLLKKSNITTIFGTHKKKGNIIKSTKDFDFFEMQEIPGGTCPTT